MKPWSGSIAPSKRGRWLNSFDPSARKAVLELAESFDRLARAAATPAVLRRRELAAKEEERNS
jgi:hypothetical protein